MLRAAGVAVGLPLLNAMLPRCPASEVDAPRRVAFIYIPNGVIAEKWTPERVGRGWTPPFSLEPLAKVKDDVLVVSGLDRTYAPGTQVHAQASACWLTSSPPSEALDGGFPTNTTLDQLFARAWGNRTPMPSIELSCNDFTDSHESRYFESISWYGPGFAASTEKDPRAVFDRLFGSPSTRVDRKGVLDVVLDSAQQLRRRLGRDDQQKLDEYLDSVRATEIRIERSEQSVARSEAPPMQRPTGIPEIRGDYLRLMGELMLLAFQQDKTRVATFVIDPERWSTPRMYHGVFPEPQNHHMLTHETTQEARNAVAKIDRFHAGVYADLIARMQSIQEPTGSLLDHSLVIMGSGLGNGNLHSYENLPMVIAGRAGGFATGQHVTYEGKRPLADLWLTMLNALGISEPRFADSTGQLQELVSG